MAFTPPWRCMGANEPIDDHAPALSAALFAAALAQREGQHATVDQRTGHDAVRAWIDGLVLAEAAAAAAEHTHSGGWPRRRPTGRRAAAETSVAHGRGASDKWDNDDDDDDDDDSPDPDGRRRRHHTDLADLPPLTTHADFGCCRSLPAEILTLDLDLPLCLSPGSPSGSSAVGRALALAPDPEPCAGSRLSQGRMARLHLALLEFLRLPPHRWPGHWRGRRYRDRAWMSAFDGPHGSAVAVTSPCMLDARAA